jgi:hypothetical protein
MAAPTPDLLSASHQSDSHIQPRSTAAECAQSIPPTYKSNDVIGEAPAVKYLAAAQAVGNLALKPGCQLLQLTNSALALTTRLAAAAAAAATTCCCCFAWLRPGLDAASTLENGECCFC